MTLIRLKKSTTEIKYMINYIIIIVIITTTTTTIIISVVLAHLSCQLLPLVCWVMLVMVQIRYPVYSSSASVPFCSTLWVSLNSNHYHNYIICIIILLHHMHHYFIIIIVLDVGPSYI